MMRDGIINGQLASLLARFRHVNSIAIVDGPFPSYLNVETVDLAVKKGFPTIPQILDLVLPELELSGVVMAKEFKAKVEQATVDSYQLHLEGIPIEIIDHEEFKVQVGKTIGIIHTGDPIPYSSVILKSG
ncbi:MAG: ribose ABC transporter [Actinobacteria bacterium]|uniref:D-ribose pyranase n=1 Tax=Candidatus Fonsibacter lacus TaxID=2576439 RepID=A0A965LL28_9PROT|nr:ribose ABC transporter [Candidatus Fonsibacter lacus]